MENGILCCLLPSQKAKPIITAFFLEIKEISANPWINLCFITDNSEQFMHEYFFTVITKTK